MFVTSGDVYIPAYMSTSPVNRSPSKPLLSLREAACLDWLPTRRRGKRPQVPTLWRWIHHGCYGVRLNATSVGGTLCVTEQGLRDFFAEISRRRGLTR